MKDQNKINERMKELKRVWGEIYILEIFQEWEERQKENILREFIKDFEESHLRFEKDGALMTQEGLSKLNL